MKEKYTYADVIINPNDKRVKIREKYYMGGTPNGVLEIANKANELFTDILIDIDDKDDFPFISGSSHGYYCCLIKPKDSQVKYTPYDLSKKEVRDKLRGKWIVRKDNELVNEEVIFRFAQDGIGFFHCNGYTAKELLDMFTFSDGTPCGEKVEE